MRLLVHTSVNSSKDLRSSIASPLLHPHPSPPSSPPPPTHRSVRLATRLSVCNSVHPLAPGAPSQVAFPVFPTGVLLRCALFVCLPGTHFGALLAHPSSPLLDVPHHPTSLSVGLFQLPLSGLSEHRQLSSPSPVAPARPVRFDHPLG